MHLILGGDDKGVSMDELFESLSGLKVKIYAIGSNSDKLMNLAAKFNVPALKCDFLQNAVNEISKELKSGEIALLSPAAASLDQFKSYAERGDKFKEFIRAL